MYNWYYNKIVKLLYNEYLFDYVWSRSASYSYACYVTKLKLQLCWLRSSLKELDFLCLLYVLTHFMWGFLVYCGFAFCHSKNLSPMSSEKLASKPKLKRKVGVVGKVFLWLLAFYWLKMYWHWIRLAEGKYMNSFRRNNIIEGPGEGILYFGWVNWLLMKYIFVTL